MVDAKYKKIYQMAKPSFRIMCMRTMCPKGDTYSSIDAAMLDVVAEDGIILESWPVEQYRPVYKDNIEESS